MQPPLTENSNSFLLDFTKNQNINWSEVLALIKELLAFLEIRVKDV